MKIVIVIDIYDLMTNGTVMTAHRFVEEFRRQGHEVKIVATGAGTGEGCCEVPELKIPLVTAVAAKQQIRFGKPDAAVLKKAFEGADIVHCYLPFPLESKARKLAKKMGIPCTAAFHLHPENITYNIGIRHSGLISRLIYRIFRRSFYRHFDHIHCPSAFIAEQLRLRKYKAKMHVISNGVDPKFVPAPPREKAAGSPFEILSIGRYASEKRQDVIIKAVAKSRYADRIHLTLAGKGPKKKKLEKLAEKYLPGRVTFGFYDSDELIRVIHRSDLYIHAADVEIEGISCIEAFSCGLVPVIADAPQSATPQFALDSRSLFKAGSVADLAKKSEYWIEPDAERRELSGKYAQRGAEIYSLEYSVRKTVEMFQEAILAFHRKQKADPKKEKKLRKHFVCRSRIFRFFSWIFYYCIAVPLLFLWLKLVFGLKVCGRENVKKARKTGAISVSNHVYLLDCAMNAVALWPKKVIFTSLGSNFKIPLAGWVLRLAGVMPIAANRQEMPVFLDELKRLLKKRRLVHMYAEGHLINYYAGLREFNKGAFMFACEAQVPVLPIVISWRRRRGWFKLFFPSKPCPTITVGEPAEADYMLMKGNQIRDLQKRVTERMQEIYDSSNGGRNVDYYQNRKGAAKEYKTRAERRAEQGEQTPAASPQGSTDGKNTGPAAPGEGGAPQGPGGEGGSHRE